MKIEAELTDEAILRELGERLARIRLDRNLTQRELAKEAGLSKRTVERMETGEVAVHFSGLARVFRALKMIDRFDAFIPESVPSPMARLKQQGKVRHRASGIKSSAINPGKWTWKDDA